MKGIKFHSIASYIPDKVVTNDDMSKIVDTSDEWIRTRTGIERRHYASDCTNVSMAVRAAEKALAQSGIDPEKLCCVVVASFTSEIHSPSVACLVQRELGLPEHVMAFDINAACSGFIYGLGIVRGLLMQNEDCYALLVGSEKLSNFTNFEDRSTCVLFGDGAGAAVLGLDERAFYSEYGAHGDDSLIYCGVGLKDTPMEPLRMNGGEVFKFAVEHIEYVINKLLEKSGLTIDDIDHVVCHQANKRIISNIARKMKSAEKFFVDIEEFGNTSSASIPIALDDMNRRGMLKRGDKIICVGFGGGLTWGGVLTEW